MWATVGGAEVDGVLAAGCGLGLQLRGGALPPSAPTPSSPLPLSPPPPSRLYPCRRCCLIPHHLHPHPSSHPAWPVPSTLCPCPTPLGVFGHYICASMLPFSTFLYLLPRAATRYTQGGKPPNKLVNTDPSVKTVDVSLGLGFPGSCKCCPNPSGKCHARYPALRRTRLHFR